MFWILRIISFFLLCIIPAQNLVAIFGINLFRAYDINLRPPIWCRENVQLTPWTEVGINADGYNPEGQRVNPLQLWTPKQDAIAMLKGFGPSSPTTKYLEDVLNSPEDNGIRGNVAFTGKFKAKEFALGFRYHAPHNITLGIYLPFFDMSLRNVRYTDCTLDQNIEDKVVRKDLTSMLDQVVAMFDPSLNLHGWKRIGPGDLFVLAEWQKDFRQQKPTLKNVGLCCRAGIALPTGYRTNIDDILSVPFGFDGSFGIIFGGGIDLTWWDRVKWGIDAEFIQLYGDTRERRIKIFPKQTDFLFLAKTQAFKDFGFTQRFNLFFEANMWRGLFLRGTYQFWKHSPDKLTLCTNTFSDSIANTAESLQQWTNHHVIAMLTYDGQYDIPEKSVIKPQLSFFYKYPFNGERALQLSTFGFTLTLNF